MNMMNQHNKEKKKYIIIILTTIFFLLFIILAHYKETYPKLEIEDVEVYTSEENHLKTAMIYNNQTIYSYGVEKILLCDQECYSLESALKHNQISLKKIKEYFQKEASKEHIEQHTLYDGGTTIYQTQNFTAIFCYNKDVYFGNTEMMDSLNGSYCGHSPSTLKTFQRTYKVLKIELQEEDILVTLQNDTETSTVKFHKEEQLIVGKMYTFTFYTYEKFSDTIPNIFQYSTVSAITETTEKINEEIIINEQESESEIEGVSMDITNLTTTSATIIITDTSGKNHNYGEEYTLEKLENNEWVKLKTIMDNYFFNDIGYVVDITNKLVLDINWENVYGPLEKGEYRIIKSTSEPLEEPKYFSKTFKIN